MENASKALIIVGSILVSIVIISLGVMIVNNATGLVKSSSDMSAQEVETFNAKFTAYEGRQSGTNVRALYDKVAQNNRLNEDDESLQVKLTVDGVGDVLGPGITENSENKGKIKAGKSYKVSFGYDDSGSGRITSIEVK